MLGLEINEAMNVEVTIKGILARAREAGLDITRDEVLDELKFWEDEDTSVWGATVDRLMGVQS